MHTHSESPYSDGEGGRVEQHLSVGGKEGDELVQGLLVVHGEQLVSLVQDKHLTLAHVSNALLHQVYDTTRSGYDHMDCREREGEGRRARERKRERERGRERRRDKSIHYQTLHVHISKLQFGVVNDELARR